MARRAEFYVVHIKRSSVASYDDVKKAMDKAVDWYRISDSLWVIYTTNDADTWYARLSPLVKESGELFICALDISDRQGWMSKAFWKFVRREK